ncbi:MAG TPA: potassium channel family protein [Pyrinomonadaceae bacterium]|nr:potassium channel family protein [Pyrinomonadaceae bacterium]
MTNEPKANEAQALRDERRQVLAQLEDWLETPMVVLGFVWLALMLWEYVWGISPLLEAVANVIWIIFILDFAVKFALAPDKTDYLKANWLTIIALAVPALRVFRVFRVVRALRAARAARGLRLVRVVTSLSRGMRALGASMGRRGFGHVIALSVVVTLAGAAGMYAFENEIEGGLSTYGEALWWTAMLLTSLGSEYWPRTAEGRVLCFLLSLYGFAVFGYVTATLATFFIGRDAESAEAEVAGAAQVESLRAEVAALREELRAFTRGHRSGGDGTDDADTPPKPAPTTT